MKRKHLLLMTGTLMVTAISLNVSLNLSAKSHDKNLMLSNVEALALGESYQGCGAAKEIVTGQKFRLQTISFGGGLNVGDYTDQAELTALQIEGTLAAETTNCYGVICYAGGGTACCYSLPWTICASTGCPTVGTWTTNP